jgi:hypothetical protein
MAALSMAKVLEIQAILNAKKYKRTRVFVGLIELLKTISKTGGYETNVDEVLDDVESWEERAKERSPVIYVVDDDTRLVRHAGCVREYTWLFKLYVVVRDDDTETMENLIGDIEECIDDNNTLLGQVNKMEIPRILTDGQLFKRRAHVQLTEMTVEILYTRGARSPRG